MVFWLVLSIEDKMFDIGLSEANISKEISLKLENKPPQHIQTLETLNLKWILLAS